MKLSAPKIRRGLYKLGKHHDGRGLFLHVVTPERGNWVFRYRFRGKEHVMGLGRAADVPLAEAREKADAARKLLARDIDPIGHRRAIEAAAEAQRAAQTTFSEAAALYITAHEPGWRNAKHRQQWRNTLATYAQPILGTVPVADIDVNMVRRVLDPIWNQKPETASRVRSRLEIALDYATVSGWRSGPNPAIWRGNLKLMLPAKSKLRIVRHHAALPWREAPAFMAQLHQSHSIGARALEFAILTAARSGEVRAACWGEIDMQHAIWTIPASRMKGVREHRVPLSPPALALLATMSELRDGSSLIFVGQRHGVPMSDATLASVLRRMQRDQLTVHGFRSTFGDWAADTGKSADAAEAALAHTLGNKTRAAYERSDLFDPRRRLMNEWAEYLAREPATVVVLKPTIVGIPASGPQAGTHYAPTVRSEPDRA
jgi:integrase